MKTFRLATLLTAMTAFGCGEERVESAGDSFFESFSFGGRDLLATEQASFPAGRSVSATGVVRYSEAVFTGKRLADAIRKGREGMEPTTPFEVLLVFKKKFGDRATAPLGADAVPTSLVEGPAGGGHSIRRGRTPL